MASRVAMMASSSESGKRAKDLVDDRTAGPERRTEIEMRELSISR